MTTTRPTVLAPAYAADAAGWLPVLGWRYPAAFTDPVEEHRRVRQAAGLFDFAFMSHVCIRGAQALALVQDLVTNDVARLARDRMLYSPLCDDDGGVVDDCTVVRTGDHEYLLTAGLGRTVDWVGRQARRFDVVVEDRSAALAVLAVQGPASAAVLDEAGLGEAGRLGYFDTVQMTWRSVPCRLARVGYTGELGWELFLPAGAAVGAWRALREAGRRAGLVACGARALDSLRIEAGYLMPGVDFDTSLTPCEAGLGRFVEHGKGPFRGREALRRRQPRRRVAGLRLRNGTGSPAGAAVRDTAGAVVGRVTSSCVSPTLGVPLAIATLARRVADGDRVVLDAGEADVTALPFYDPARRRVRQAPAALRG